MTLRRTKQRTRQHTIYIPNELSEALRQEAEEEDCSMSWIVCEELFNRYGIEPSDLPGERPAKTKTERKQQWEDKQKQKQKSKELSNEQLNEIVERVRQNFQGNRRLLQFQTELDKYDLSEEQIENLTEEYFDALML